MGGIDNLHNLYRLYNMLAKLSKKDKSETEQGNPPKTVAVALSIVDVIASQQKFDSEFKVTPNYVLTFIDCVEQAFPFFSPFVSSRNYVSRICLDILPKLDDIIKITNGKDFASIILKYLAEISIFFTKEDNIGYCIKNLYNCLLTYIPLPPATEDGNDLEIDEPNFQFTHIECLLYTFIQFLKHNDSYITSTENLNRFKDLKLRLRFLYFEIVSELKNTEEAQKTVKIDDQEYEESEAIAKNNIIVLIKDFFRKPPSFESAITLSWKHAKSESENSSRKREKRESDAPVVRNVKRKRRVKVGTSVPPGPTRHCCSGLCDKNIKRKKNKS